MNGLGIRSWLQRSSLNRLLSAGLRSTLRGRRRSPFANSGLPEQLELRLLPTVLTVQNLHDSGAGSLRDAVAASQSGDTIQFAKKLSGTITLTTGQIDVTHDLTIQGTGANRIKISGNNASRIFEVADLDTSDSEVPDFTLSGLSLIKGQATSAAATLGQAAGGAIAFLAAGGDLNLTNVTLSDNQAVGTTGTDAAGGAIFFLAQGSHAVNLTNCLVTRNQALGGNHGGLAVGGAIAALSSTGISSGYTALLTQGTTFQGNRAVGGNGGIERTSAFLSPSVGQVGGALGGAVAAVGVKYFLSTSTFTANVAQAGSGGSSDLSPGGMTYSNSFVATAGGGAAAGLGFGNINLDYIQQSTFTGNTAIGGSNAVGKAPGALDLLSDVGCGLGGAQFTFGCYATVGNSTFSGNSAVGGDDNSVDAGGTVPPMVGNGRGGAIYTAGMFPQLVIGLSLIENNVARGGTGGSTSQYPVTSGDYGPLDSAAGGGVQSDAVDAAKLGIKQTIIRNNQAIGGSGGDGPGAGSAYGGGVGRMGGDFTLLESVTITGNSAVAANGTEGVGSESGGDASGGGIFSPGSTDLTIQSKIFGNRAVAGAGADSGSGGIARGGGGILGGDFEETEIDSNLAVAANGGQFGAPGESYGGGLFLNGATNFTASSVTNNQAFYGGGIFNRYGNLTMTSSTVGANTAAVFGGGIYLSHYDATFYSTLTLTNVTIARNAANYPADIADAGSAVYTDYAGNSTVVRNSIIAENTGAVWGGVQTGIAYAITGDYNYWDNLLLGNLGSHSIIKTFDPSTDLLLGPLGYYGGQTQTFALLPGSPAIDSGESNGLSTDQRGILRPQNGFVDRGAFESQGFRITIVSGNNQTAAAGKRFTRPLVVKVSANNPLEPVEGGVVIFTPPAAGPSATIAPSNRVTIGRSKKASATATANILRGTYTIRAGGSGFNVPEEFVETNR